MFVAGHIEAAEFSNPIDLCIDGLPAANKLTELWLPQSGAPFRLRALTLSDGAFVGP